VISFLTVVGYFIGLGVGVFLHRRHRRQLKMIREALGVFDSSCRPRSHVEALDFVADVRFRLGGHHVAYPENRGNPLFDRSAEDGPWRR
jgi:hypothetical protein